MRSESHPIHTSVGVVRGRSFLSSNGATDFPILLKQKIIYLFPLNNISFFSYFKKKKGKSSRTAPESEFVNGHRSTLAPHCGSKQGRAPKESSIRPIMSRICPIAHGSISSSLSVVHGLAWLAEGNPGRLTACQLG